MLGRYDSASRVAQTPDDNDDGFQSCTSHNDAISCAMSPPSTLIPNLTPSSDASSPYEEHAPRCSTFGGMGGTEEEELGTNLMMQHQRNTKSCERRRRVPSRRRKDASNYRDSHHVHANQYHRGKLRSRSQQQHQQHYPNNKCLEEDSILSTPETALESSDEMSSDSSISPMEWGHKRRGPLQGRETYDRAINISQSSFRAPHESIPMASSSSSLLTRRSPLTSPRYSSTTIHQNGYYHDRTNNLHHPQVSSSSNNSRGPGRSKYIFCCIIIIGVISFTLMAAIVNDRLVFITLDSDFATMGPRSDYMTGSGSNHYGKKSSVRRAVIGLRPFSPKLFSSGNKQSVTSSLGKNVNIKKEHTTHDKKKDVADSKTSTLKLNKDNKNEPGNHMKHTRFKKVAYPWKHRKKKEPWGQDPLLYASNENDTGENNMISNQSYSRHKPKVLYIDEEEIKPINQPPQEVELYPARFSDNTQLYSVLDSNDEALSSMEMRTPFHDGECAPMKEWQTTFHPTCNGIHEIDFIQQSQPDLAGDVHLFGTKGYWRNAWRVDFSCKKLNETHTGSCQDSVVMKTLKYHHNFEDAHYEHDRIDAVAMERLTSSPHVINIFGFCAHSVVTEYADGQRVGTLADKSKRTPLARLKIARDIASGLADVHGIDGDEEATFVHFDVNPANVVSIGGTLKLNDFNIGVILKRNETSGKACGFPSKYPNPQVRFFISALSCYVAFVFFLGY